MSLLSKAEVKRAISNQLVATLQAEHDRLSNAHTDAVTARNWKSKLIDEKIEKVKPKFLKKFNKLTALAKDLGLTVETTKGQDLRHIYRSGLDLHVSFSASGNFNIKVVTEDNKAFDRDIAELTALELKCAEIDSEKRKMWANIRLIEADGIVGVLTQCNDPELDAMLAAVAKKIQERADKLSPSV